MSGYREPSRRHEGRPEVQDLRRRRTASLFLVGLAVSVLIVGSAAQASAHAFLLSTSPAAGYAVPTSPAEIALDFDEEVSVAGHPLTLSDAAGRPVALGAPTLRKRGREVAARPVDTLAAGGYVVRWEVSSGDGDTVTGSFGFGVGATAPGVSNTRGTAGLPWAVAFRWLLFAGLALAIGSCVCAWVIGWRRTHGIGPAPPVLTGSVLILVAATGLAVLALGGGSLAAGIPRLVSGGAFTEAASRAVLVEVAAGAIAVAASLVRRHSPATLLPLLVVVGAEGVRSHADTRAGALGAALLAIHLLAAAIWVGALVYVVRLGTVWRDDRPALRWAVLSYARLAVLLFFIVLVTGTLAAILLIRPIAAIYATGYGRTLLVKLGLVAFAAALAVRSRRSLFDASREPGPAPPARTARTEAAVLAGVLAVTAVLVSLPNPAPAATGLAAPPPPVGPTVQLGALAGQINLAITASSGQLIVRLATPGSDEPAQAGRSAILSGDDPAKAVPPSFALTGQIVPPAGEPQPLFLRSCGSGCFLAPVSWLPGSTTLTLTPAATGWHTVTVRFRVPWHPVSAAALARRVVTRLAATSTLVVTERATSDTSTDFLATNTVRLSGGAFLVGEAYPSEIPSPVELDHSGASSAERTTIAFAIPGEGVDVRWVIDSADRLVAEDLVTPAHQLERTFTYPDR